MAGAIKEIHIRWAGLIGAAAGFGTNLVTLEAEKSEDFERSLKFSSENLKSVRPTAVNLVWALNRQIDVMAEAGRIPEQIRIPLESAQQIADEDAAFCERIGNTGSSSSEESANPKAENRSTF